jgi:hypothetical protein
MPPRWAWASVIRFARAWPRLSAPRGPRPSSASPGVRYRGSLCNGTMSAFTTRCAATSSSAVWASSSAYCLVMRSVQGNCCRTEPSPAPIGRRARRRCPTSPDVEVLLVQIQVRVEHRVPDIGVLPDDHIPPCVPGQPHAFRDRCRHSGRLDRDVCATSAGRLPDRRETLGSGVVEPMSMTASAPKRVAAASLISGPPTTITCPAPRSWARTAAHRPTGPEPWTTTVSPKAISPRVTACNVRESGCTTREDARRGRPAARHRLRGAGRTGHGEVSPVGGEHPTSGKTLFPSLAGRLARYLPIG